MQYLNNFHAFTITFIGATNNKGSRVKIKSERFEQSKTIDYDHKYNGTKEVAQAWLEDSGFNLIGQAETKNSYILLSDTFKPLK